MTDDDPEEDGFVTDPRDIQPKREKLKPKYIPKVPQQDRPETDNWR